MYNIHMYVYITYMYVNEYIYITYFFWKMYLCCLNSKKFQATDVLNKTRSQGQVAAQQKKKR